MWNRLSKGYVSGDRLTLAIAYFDDMILARLGLWLSKCTKFDVCVKVGKAYLEKYLHVMDNCIKYGDAVKVKCIRIGSLVYDGELLIRDYEIVNLRHIMTLAYAADEKYISLTSVVGSSWMFSDVVLLKRYGFIYRPFVDRIKYVFASEFGEFPSHEDIQSIHEEVSENVKREMERYITSRNRIVFRDMDKI